MKSCKQAPYLLPPLFLGPHNFSIITLFIFPFITNNYILTISSTILSFISFFLTQ
ncbi:hypothetical protein Lalb_Chr09g0334791 [Lupinus albus]|uniref:Uncharacterized protein n=1 Tax=Lupinus albus TaxID=3870 RepID=A0A6A4Q2X6_LUPAL|nr:hypothetical protein Lalb_Chr09g0334791 [Lupinus albus]